MKRIVAATQMRDFVLVFCEDGTIYRVAWDSYTESIAVRIEATINLGVR